MLLQFIAIKSLLFFIVFESQLTMPLIEIGYSSKKLINQRAWLDALLVEKVIDKELLENYYNFFLAHKTLRSLSITYLTFNLFFNIQYFFSFIRKQ
jgi:hypothetical protein